MRPLSPLGLGKHGEEIVFPKSRDQGHSEAITTGGHVWWELEPQRKGSQDEGTASIWRVRKDGKTNSGLFFLPSYLLLVFWAEHSLKLIITGA